MRQYRQKDHQNKCKLSNDILYCNTCVRSKYSGSIHTHCSCTWKNSGKES